MANYLTRKQVKHIVQAADAHAKAVREVARLALELSALWHEDGGIELANLDSLARESADHNMRSIHALTASAAPLLRDWIEPRERGH